MLIVCKTHVVEGLKVTDTPHIIKLPKSKKCKCKFCEEQADFRLFHLY